MHAYRADGLKFGSRENEEASIFLEPQPWAVYSGHSTGGRAEEITNVVNGREIAENLIPVEQMEEQNEALVLMG